VVVFHERNGDAGQSTVVTETHGLRDGPKRQARSLHLLT
jgi:hypothetical protein